MRRAWQIRFSGGGRFETRLRESSGPLVGALVGFLVALIGFGPAYVFGTSPFWQYPPTDFSSHLIGWREYVQEPWTYPLLLSRKLDHPDGLNILYMDSLPLVALLVKAVRGLVPDAMRTLMLNPLGWWQLVSYALQGVFAALLAASLRAKWIAQVSCALVAMSMQIFIARFCHTGLNSHFLILAALWLYVRSNEPAEGTKAIALVSARWTALLVSAMLLHPYLFAMVAAVFAATAIRWTASRRFVVAGAAIGMSVLTVVGVMLICGYFGARLSRASDWGFGHKSTDLLSFFVPQHSPFYPNRNHKMALDLAHDEAAEGCDYLGIGLLALGIVMAIASPTAIASAIRRNKALSAVLVAMTLFAFSNRISVGGHVVFELPFPRAAGWIVGQFRASGRFIWPPTYAAAVYLVVIAYRRFSAGWLAFVPPALVLLQFVDGMGNFGFVRSYTARPERMWLDWSVFEPVVAAHPEITIRPSYSCVGYGHDHAVMMQMEVATMAAARGTGISGVRSSRYLADCSAETTKRLRSDLDPGRLHVFFPPDVPAAEAVHLERRGVRCGFFGTAPRDAFICSREMSAIPPGFSAAPRVDYLLGSTSAVGGADTSPRIGHGWSYPETTHRWSDGPSAALYFRVDPPAPAGTRLRIQGGAAIFPSRPEMTVHVSINDAPAGVLSMTSLDARPFDVALPAPAIGERLVEVQLAFDDVRSPKELGINADERKLGIYVQTVALLPPDSP